MINESSPAAFLADCILESPYFNDAPIAYPPFASDPAPALLTFDDLAAYCDYFDDEPLRDALISMLDLDLRDLAHNSNFDAFLDDDTLRDLSDDDLDDITHLLNADTDLYERLADALLARAFDCS